MPKGWRRTVIDAAALRIKSSGKENLFDDEQFSFSCSYFTQIYQIVF